MGKHDYEKSYSRQMESIVISLYAIYAITELFLGFQNGWNQWGQMAVLFSMLVAWVFFFGKYKTYEIRAYVVSTMAQVTILAYAVEIGDFFSVISVFISLCILLGLYGIPKVDTHKQFGLCLRCGKYNLGQCYLFHTHCR